MQHRAGSPDHPPAGQHDPRQTTVAAIAQERAAHMGHVNPQLVGTPGFRIEPQQPHRPSLGLYTVAGHGSLRVPLPRRDHLPETPIPRTHTDGSLYRPLPIGRAPLGQSHITPHVAPFCAGFLQSQRGGSRPRKGHNARHIHV